MFENSLLESGKREKTHRGATTLLSVAIQGLFVGALILAPMIYTDTLPGFSLRAEALVAPVTPPPRGITQQETTTGGGGGGGEITPILTEVPNDVIREPDGIPRDIARINDFGGPPNLPPGPGRGCPTCVPDGVSEIMPPPIVRPVAAPPRVKVPPSVLERGHLVRKVTPQYPEIARRLRVEGQVVLHAVIGRDGSMQSVRVLRGHTMLNPAAEEAVRQWRYRPYVLNGQATEVETQITVNFVLSR